MLKRCHFENALLAAHMENLFKLLLEKNSIIIIITQKQAFIDIVLLPSYKNPNVLADANQHY